jgi:hypothetical protein
MFLLAVIVVLIILLLCKHKRAQQGQHVGSSPVQPQLISLQTITPPGVYSPATQDEPSEYSADKLVGYSETHML